MAELKIEKNWFMVEPSFSIPSLCWTARELLGGYMDEGYPLVVDKEVDLLGDLAPEGSEISEDDDDEQDSGIYVHSTPGVLINENDTASLSNLPYVQDHEGLLVPCVDPGYVALRIEPASDGPIDIGLHLDPRCDQYTFRVPNPSREEEAAIFHGFTLDPEAEIGALQITTLKKLGILMDCLRIAFRQLLSEDAELFGEAYLSVVPVRPVGDSILDELFG